ncbi:MAG: glycoside hydrolase family 108 protein [Hyphomicrobiaceae bacterium]
MRLVLAQEGGWTEDPHDPGGPTNRGIVIADLAAHHGVAVNRATFAALREELRAIPEALVRTIYLERYWRPACCPDLPPPLALFHFDAAVNHGLTGAAVLLQRALRVTADGEIGPLTRRAARDGPIDATLARYAELRRRRYRELPHFWRFGRGWLARVDATLAEARRTPAGLAGPRISNPRKDEPMQDDTTDRSAATSKWWGQSLTIWGTLVTAAATVLPLVGPMMGLDLTPDLVRQVGDQTLAVIQAATGLIGTLMAIVGRTRASTRLERRPFTVEI